MITAVMVCVLEIACGIWGIWNDGGDGNLGFSKRVDALLTDDRLLPPCALIDHLRRLGLDTTAYWQVFLVIWGAL